MSKSPLEYLRRGLRTPPDRVARFVLRRIHARLDAVVSPRISRRLTRRALLRRLGAADFDSAWRDLAAAPFALDVEAPAAEAEGRVLAAARAALERRVDLLGSGPRALGTPIDWHTDFKAGHTWPQVPFRHVRLVEPDNAADVKIPWELSRLQWLLPAGQAFLASGDDAFAAGVRDIVAEWIAGNPLGVGVNWACAMEPALRAVTLIWLFHACHAAPSWRDGDFRFAFLKCLYEHGDFVARHLEWADVNGNHLLADAVGLVFVGGFLGRGQWWDAGWRILASEVPAQVHPDGVDFEGSAAYHRFVLELALLAALFRLRRGAPVGADYRDRLAAMARFVAAASAPGGDMPMWGDADDGRVLPLAGEPDLVAMTDAALQAAPAPPPSSARFPDGGVCVMRTDQDRVFIDCGPVGMAGRGGHGHNDCLAIDAVLAGAPVLVDCGSYVYGASVEWRNRFRATAAHNTPMVDDAEVNRFVRPDYLWTLRPDAVPEPRRWETSDAADVFVGAHAGYRRLADPATPVRTVILEKATHRLIVGDRLEAAARHRVTIPYHLAPGTTAHAEEGRRWRLDTGFVIVWDGDDLWRCDTRGGWYSPSYGVKHAVTVIEFRRDGPPTTLLVAVLPAEHVPPDAIAWLRDTYDQRTG